MFRAYIVLIVIISSLFFQPECRALEGTEASANTTKIDEESPSYDKIVPVIGWERYSGDSARSVKGWVRWWKYLRLKKPITMKWIDDLILRIHPGSEVFRSLFVRGIYDPNLVVVIDSLLPQGGVFLDIGANMGYVSLLASRKVGEKGKVFALEPSSRDFRRLVDNVNINGLGNIIFPHRLAASDKNTKMKLLIASEERNFLNTSGSEISFKGVEKVGTEEVAALPLDAFVENEKIKRIDVIKLDIEGSELYALKGAKNTIERYHPAIILGVNHRALKICETDCSELQKSIDEMKYHIYRIAEKPIFALEKIANIADVRSGVIICLHESVVPPVLPQPKKRSVSEDISDFFLR
ncbi:MAG: FkbM family methyltransferase [Holosporaceae bacterium]|nr:FkbM family methyltransferase [Holosporaceae bacterium]